MSTRNLTRRQALRAAGGMVTGSKLAQAQTAAAPGGRPDEPRPVRLAPRAELVNVLEYEEQARLKLAPAVYALISGGDRAAFDRITLRPRLLVPTLDMDLSVTLFGEKLFAPIVVGPVGNQGRFHGDGELATVTGASAARAVTVLSSHSSIPPHEIAARARTRLWYQVFAGDPAARTQIQDAVKAGCRAICITLGAVPAPNGGREATATTAKTDWAAIDALKRGVSVPVMVKGITTPAAARQALQRGVDGIVVSDYGGRAAPGADGLILALPHIVDAVEGKVPVLADGSFRRGTDILKALAFGARSVLVGRPAMWGLAAYGADGVQGVVEMLQTELGRYMGMCGKSHVGMLDRTVLTVHGVWPRKAPGTGPERGANQRRLKEARRG